MLFTPSCCQSPTSCSLLLVTLIYVQRESEKTNPKADFALKFYVSHFISNKNKVSGSELKKYNALGFELEILRNVKF